MRDGLIMKTYPKNKMQSCLVTFKFLKIILHSRNQVRLFLRHTCFQYRPKSRLNAAFGIFSEYGLD